MLFWIVIAAISAVVVVAVTQPLLMTRKVTSGPNALTAATAIYDAQLAELEREASRGQLTDAEFESAKGELGRRLIRAGKNLTPITETNSPQRMPLTALALTVMLPVGALAIYLSVGAPGVPSQTAEARAAAKQERTKYQSLISALEAALAAGKGDAQGWRLLIQAYQNLGDNARALDALKRAEPWLRAKGSAPPADLLAALGAGLTAEASETVTARAATVLREALAGDRKNMTARFYLGLERMQAGDAKGARGFWAPLLAELPPGTPLHEDLTRRLSKLPANLP